jgi:hypothetical protein
MTTRERVKRPDATKVRDRIEEGDPGERGREVWHIWWLSTSPGEKSNNKREERDQSGDGEWACPSLKGHIENKWGEMRAEVTGLGETKKIGDGERGKDRELLPH